VAQDDPFIEADMLSDERDRVRLGDGIRRVATLVETAAISNIAENVSFGTTGLSMATLATLADEELDQVLLAQASDAQHASGTCRMAAYEDSRGVVNPNGTVKGIGGLRVADASIMPLDCRANTHFTTMMIGEMIAMHMARSGP
jgi:choline dehydrogenase